MIMPKHEELIVRLVISSKTLTAQDISKTCQLVFDRVWKAGDKVPKGEARYPKNGCLLESGLDRTQPIEAHLERLFERIGPHREELKALRDCEIGVECVLYFYVANTSLIIPPVQMEKLSQMGAALSFDLYGLAEG